MKAIQIDIQTVIRQIVSADIDIALICHKGPNIEMAFQSLLKGIRNNRRLRTQHRASVQRIMNLKQRYLPSD